MNSPESSIYIVILSFSKRKAFPVFLVKDEMLDCIEVQFHSLGEVFRRI